MLTDRQQFKAAFMQKCAAQGLSLEEMTKTAFSLADALGGITRLGSGAAGAVTGNVVPLIAAGPAALGYLSGYVGANVADQGTPTRVKSLQDEDRIREYRRLAQEAKLNQSAANYQRQRQRTGRIF